MERILDYKLYLKDNGRVQTNLLVEPTFVASHSIIHHYIFKKRKELHGCHVEKACDFTKNHVAFCAPKLILYY